MDKTVNEIYEDYVEYLALSYKPNTIELIEFKFKNHILPWFGQMKLSSINEQDYIKFQIHLLKYNYSNSFIEQVQGMCNKFFDYLSLMYKIDNVPRRVGMVKNKATYESPQKKGTWTKKEFRKFNRKVKDRVYHALFNTLYYSGMRKSEATQLKIKDYKKGCIHILNGKTEKSRRNIKVDIFTRFELFLLIKYYKKTYSNYSEDFYLFGGINKIPYTTLERKKNEYCKKAGVKQIRIHDFRHSHATMLYYKKTKLKAIQERLGHAHASTTIDMYVHNDEKEQKRLIKTINLMRL